jgi:hypothetical protein
VRARRPPRSTRTRRPRHRSRRPAARTCRSRRRCR